ncbi:MULTISPECIES: O-antigen ligase domain-containing protein [unclassified Leptolyngbya]|uniref:O-antigen ligase domain-containing protein n=1 Tax=unclassified Leptolyngbya TaxID=2650499 RepID=UPI0016847D46|nr:MULTISPECIES: O-antigen ligase domain-containing protein [unclassified Leptolyngbya]MBD1912805.1 O-antigen ligase domain-containing protein [Leptolyngbya sp. FACHB-8]MBD2157752.1 O-antigen ligase domain-containing protein [Leptolyngbya sp. FACHB-16]
MSPLVPLVMFGWIPMVLYLFSRYPASRAIVISFVAAWLFLPQASFPLPGLPDYTKMSATCYGVLLATALFDSGRFTTFRPHWIDIPILLWCASPMASSLTNGLGAYDGFSQSLEQTISWGLPYFLGRLYLGNWAGLKQLAIAIFIGGLAYIPFIFFELRFSPQLHRMVYGFHAHADFSQTIRYGGYRPTVFMQHGLAVGAWMMAATLVGIWLWQTGVVKEVWGIKMKWLVPIILVTFILCKSTGAYMLLLFGLAILYAGKYLRTSILLLLIVALVNVYLYTAASGMITPERREVLIEKITNTFGEERAQSLEFRMKNEEILGERAREQPVFGWGGWGRARVYDENGKDLTVTDSLWIIAFGDRGLFGLISMTAAMLIPPIIFSLGAYPIRAWSHPIAASSAVLVTIITLYMVDCVLNAMINPIYVMALGGVSGLLAAHPPIVNPRRRLRQARSKEKYALPSS